MIHRRNLILVGPLPIPGRTTSGQAECFRLLADACTRRIRDVAILDVANRYSAVNQSSFLRAIEVAWALIRFCVLLIQKPRKVYLTIAQSKRGFRRDALFVWLGRAVGARIVLHLHGGNYGEFYGSQSSRLQWLIRKTLREADILIVLGEQLRASFDFDQAVFDRTRVVPNGWHRPEGLHHRRTSLRIADRPRILFLSNLVESKGWPQVLEVVARLRDHHGIIAEATFAGSFIQNPDDDVVVKSSSHARQLFGEIANQLGIANQVRWVGTVDAKRKIEILQAHDFFVLPTRYAGEGQPVSILEAMALGLVVIAPPYRSIPDMVADGVTGHLIPAHDVAAMAASIAADTDPETYARLSAASQDRFDRFFSAEVHLERMLGILENLHREDPTPCVA